MLREYQPVAFQQLILGENSEFLTQIIDVSFSTCFGILSSGKKRKERMELAA